MFEGQRMENVTSFDAAFSPLNNYLEDEYQFAFADDSLDKVQNILKDSSLGVKDKNKYLNDLLGAIPNKRKKWLI